MRKKHSGERKEGGALLFHLTITPSLVGSAGDGGGGDGTTMSWVEWGGFQDPRDNGEREEKKMH